MTHTTTRHELIKGYRRMIEQRYQYERIASQYDIPASFDEERVALFRQYFLAYIYPPAHKREALDAAFEHLDSYIKQPEKLLRLLLDSTSLLFKYGRHLPKILMAGLKALKSFRVANQFEEKLIAAANNAPIQPPYSVENIYQFLRILPREEIEDFIVQSEPLLATLHDRVLVRKIIEIVEQLIQKMRQRPNLFSPEEVRGLQIGYELIKEGNGLFDQLSKEDQQQIFKFILQIERDVLKQLFEI
ncbi:MAG: hypothetical protein AAF738_03675 [Bacteroidota bacterium]